MRKRHGNNKHAVVILSIMLIMLKKQKTVVIVLNYVSFFNLYILLRSICYLKAKKYHKGKQCCRKHAKQDTSTRYREVSCTWGGYEQSSRDQIVNFRTAGFKVKQEMYKILQM